MARSLIIGGGEVGNALKEVLSKAHKIEVKDIEEAQITPEPDVLHIALNYVELGPDKWRSIVDGYVKLYRPRLIDVCSTVAPGTTEKLGSRAVHSTTRGLHPRLADGLSTITKHIGGPAALKVAAHYRAAKIPVQVHRRARTTETNHLTHLIAYGIAIMGEDATSGFTRYSGTDYLEYMRYVMTGNAGYRALDMDSKSRMVLTPPNGKIGGHCVVQAAKVAMQSGYSHPLVRMLAAYNEGDKHASLLEEAAQVLNG